MRKRYFLVILIIFFLFIFVSIVSSVPVEVTIEYPDGVPSPEECDVIIKSDEIIGINITVPLELTPICGKTLTINIGRYTQSKIIRC